jgi:hypothetical protein
VLVAIVLGSAGLLTIGTWQVREWIVMTDELLYVKLARHIATTGSPVPSLHGQRVGFLGVVYPILLSPLYGALDPFGAFEAAHVVNALLFASAAIPVYLLTRRLAPTGCALVVALLSVAIPWSLHAAFVMSEAAAYPVFTWAVLAIHGAVTEPSPRRDVLVVAALALAFFTRPQFLFLAVVLPIAVLACNRPRRALARHRVLAGAYAIGVAVVVPLAALGESHRLLGDYGVTATEGSLLPSTVWKSAAIHVDVLAVGLGVVPFLLGAGWAYSALRDEAVRLRSFAAIAAAALPLLVLETASYDVRFGGTDTFRDRYLFYLAPLLLISSALALQGERLPIVGIAGATAFFAATAGFADFTPVAGILVDSPESVLNGAIHDQSAGLPAGVFVAVCGVLLGAICLGLAWIPRPAAMLVVTVAIFAFGGSVAGYAFDRLLTSRTVAGLPVTGQSRVRDWIDRTTRGSVGVLAYPVSRDWGQSAEAWWDAEFWNDSATRAFVGPEGTFTYTPFPDTTLRVDRNSGVLPGTEHAAPYVLTAQNDSRFRLAGSQSAANGPFVVLAVDRPYHALWATSGLDADGWARPGRPVVVRVYAQPGGSRESMRAEVVLDSPPEAQASAQYRLGATTGSLPPGARAVAQTDLCMPKQGHADVTLTATRSATIAGVPLGPDPGPPRDVGVAVSSIRLAPGGSAC